MEKNTVIQEASKGSPMLAYGKAGSSMKRRLFFWISLPILLIAIPVILLTCLFFFGETEMPKERLLAISIQPSSINKNISGALITELPAPWRTAVETNTSLPIILGLAKTKSGSIAPYAIVPRILSISSSDQNNIIEGSLIKTILRDDIETERGAYRLFSKLLNAQNSADAGFMINEALLLMLSGEAQTDARDDIPVYGSIKGTRGKIFLSSEDETGESANGQLFAFMGKNLKSDNAISNQLLTQGIDVRDLRMPESLNLKGDGSIRLSWNEVSAEDQDKILVALGQTTSTPFKLPDEVTANIITPQTTTTSNAFTFQDTWKASDGSATEWKTSCPGNVRLNINGEALQNLLTLAKVPLSWRENIRSFVISSEDGKNIFCINE
jgi:hypothetical protein